jgi:hypothetical protein
VGKEAEDTVAEVGRTNERRQDHAEEWLVQRASGTVVERFVLPKPRYSPLLAG